MQQKFTNVFRIVALSFVFSVGVGVVLADWVQPSAIPPNNNTPSPVNVGATAQMKDGNLFLSAGHTFSSTLGLFGQIGISTTSPASSLKLGVEGNIGAAAYCDQNGRNCASAPFGGAGGGFWVASGNNIYNTNTGNVGIGKSNPLAKLDVGGLAIFDKAAVGTTATVGSTKLTVRGDVASSRYCDINGQNCATPPFGGGGGGVLLWKHLKVANTAASQAITFGGAEYPTPLGLCKWTHPTVNTDYIWYGTVFKNYYGGVGCLVATYNPAAGFETTWMNASGRIANGGGNNRDDGGGFDYLYYSAN